MHLEELQRLLAGGEDSQHQFKREITHPDSLAAELVALSNSGGGQIFVGVEDDGRISGLSPQQVRAFNQLLSNTASNNVRPPIHPSTQNIVTEQGVVIVVTVAAGLNQPYMDAQGRVWVKNGADKRHVTSREEMQRMFLNAGLIQADTLPVPGTSVADVDWAAFDAYYRKRFNQPCPEAEHTASLTSLGLLKNQQLTLAGVLLFGLQPQRWLPVCMVKAVAFYGNSIGDTQYQDSEDIDGTLTEQFQRSFAFIKRNLHHVQNGRGFNTLGELEVPPIALEELLVNALMHRDYFDSASIRILVFRDRIEIISPGHLPGNLSTEDIQHGKTKRRNPILSEHAAHLLPYRGLGSGIHRARQAWPQIELQDHRSGNEFRAVVARPKPATQVIAPAGIGAEGTRPPVTPEVTDPVTDLVADPVVRLLRVLVDGALPPSEIQHRLGLKHRPTFRANYLHPALAAGWVEMTLPDKPTSRLQRYRLTEAGQALVPPQQGHNP